MNASDANNLLLVTSIAMDWIAKAQQLLAAQQAAGAAGRGLTDAEVAVFVAGDDAAKAKLQADIDARTP